MRPLYMLTCICRGQHAAVFGIQLHRNCLYTGVHMCTWRLYAYIRYIACMCRGKGGGGGGGEGGAGNPKANRYPRKECP